MSVMPRSSVAFYKALNNYRALRIVSVIDRTFSSSNLFATSCRLTGMPWTLAASSANVFSNVAEVVLTVFRRLTVFLYVSIHFT